MRFYTYSIMVFDANGKEVALTRELKTSFLSGLKAVGRIPASPLVHNRLFTFSGATLPEWKNWEKNMMDFSKMFPDYLFTIEISTVISKDSITMHFRNGQAIHRL